MSPRKKKEMSPLSEFSILSKLSLLILPSFYVASAFPFSPWSSSFSGLLSILEAISASVVVLLRLRENTPVRAGRVEGKKQGRSSSGKDRRSREKSIGGKRVSPPRKLRQAEMDSRRLFLLRHSCQTTQYRLRLVRMFRYRPISFLVFFSAAPRIASRLLGSEPFFLPISMLCAV